MLYQVPLRFSASTRARLDYGLYIPTWVEWSLVAGTFAAAALIYTLFLKIFPIVEISEELH